ncbi:hypothetical protein [Streptomyces griseus]|uniref:hypothetical protein n=1 Tax=Streptomyces griseus TaxID=1911 RepID=UPI0020C7AFE3|nr:hypothetical protein [Streptomyces griseus]
MIQLAPDTFATWCKGMSLPTLSAVFAEAGHPISDGGRSSGWTWVTHDARTASASASASASDGFSVSALACYVTGFRYADRADLPEPMETVFLASTPACPCEHGQNYMVPHCDVHPFQFAYSRGGFARTCFNMGDRRESRRSGDLLVRELLDAGIIGRDTPAYEADPGFNAGGTLTLRIIADHFALPSPPLLR